MAFAESMGEPPPIDIKTSHPDSAMSAVASRISPIGLGVSVINATLNLSRGSRMLTDLAECPSVNGSQALFNVLDHWRLFVKRSTGDDERLGASKLRYNVGKLFTRS